MSFFKSYCEEFRIYKVTSSNYVITLEKGKTERLHWDAINILARNNRDLFETKVTKITTELLREANREFPEILGEKYFFLKKHKHIILKFLNTIENQFIDFLYNEEKELCINLQVEIDITGENAADNVKLRLTNIASHKIPPNLSGNIYNYLYEDDDEDDDKYIQPSDISNWLCEAFGNAINVHEPGYYD
jgi:hypothetical protein